MPQIQKHSGNYMLFFGFSFPRGRKSNFPQQQNPVTRIITSNPSVNHPFQQPQRRFTKSSNSRPRTSFLNDPFPISMPRIQKHQVIIHYFSFFFFSPPGRKFNPISIQFHLQQQNPISRIRTSNPNKNHSIQQFHRRFFQIIEFLFSNQIFE